MLACLGVLFSPVTPYPCHSSTHLRTHQRHKQHLENDNSWISKDMMVNHCKLLSIESLTHLLSASSRAGRQREGGRKTDWVVGWRGEEASTIFHTPCSSYVTTNSSHHVYNAYGTSWPLPRRAGRRTIHEINTRSPHSHQNPWER